MAIFENPTFLIVVSIIMIASVVFLKVKTKGADDKNKKD